MAKTPTQQFLEIDKIKEGVIILKDKSLRGVLMTSSINFALKSEDEQTAIIYQFQDFLNSLDFSIQIVIQSRKLNITGYLDKLKKLEEGQKDELLKIQTSEYRAFIQKIISGGTIMSKNFFVIVPFTAITIPGVREKGSAAEEQFRRNKAQLWQRMEFIAMGLRRCGLQTASLTTVELIELFWALYHPEQAETGYYPEIPEELNQ
ncbi:MAG: hypothetical protein COX37_03095 [Candidatus Nealsonbacteria bacterium CG23_combo_of_CG06-09_8_20_14_all_39_17]|uniref:Uncharacterized protein n=1 Tax=Candidatus Nealsonbacteria bacterium CG23_combo_of_CG06-09_8_20_14_all_39_17 TaxID=1974722 RepID=A0A2G9YVT7_9BACT|nr:MAG: hypothetical protein COX37_03095 [Candidatus Nealsonbacteria bacterium CG23_combo_of_CG06-09_8_20_14_all_39_17]PIU44240.1 MAG: hypothetical protein COS96_00090 [Candidatus Nealsonbacteria bacterium CG07_land_8_20_14_0_80_39_13]